MRAMGDMLIMSKKELDRKTLLDAVRCKKLKLIDAAKRMDITYRQAKRIWRKYKEKKDVGLCPGNRGKIPPNAYSEGFKTRILSLYQQKYMEFGPTFASEKMLEDDGLSIHEETLRLWLKKEGLWQKQRKRKIYRECRPKRLHFGDLLQIDGSIHRWFSGSEDYSCLLNIVDDATGTTLAILDKGETTKVLLIAFKKWVEKYGIPKAVYVDLKSVYVSPKRLKEKYDDDLLVQDGFSIFEQMCRGLGIEIIRAYSPQAKGRVERKHRVFQDRFVKDLKLYGITTIDAANIYLEEKFLNKINHKFATKPAEKKDSHRKPAPHENLEEIFTWNYRRQLKNDWTIQFKRTYFQVKKPVPKTLEPGDQIIIRKYLDGQIRFWFQESELQYQELKRKPEPPSKSKQYYEPKGEFDPQLRSQISKNNKHFSPWSQFNPNWLKSSKQKEKLS
jgi:transposase